MLTLKETFVFLSKNPSHQDISRILNINKDTLIYLDLLYKELQLKKSKINQFIKKIAKNERNTLEKAFIEIYTGTKHKESSFLERLYLSKKYGSVFTDYLKKYKRYKNINETLLNIFYIKEVKNKEKVYKIIKKSSNFIEILPFFQGIIPEEKYFKFLKNKDLEIFCELINQIKGEPFYKLLSKKISNLSIEKTIILVNNITFLDNLTLYKHLLKIFYEKNKPFKKFKEYFKIIWIDDQNKLEILFCWLRIFILKKQFKRFISLYKYLEGIQEKEMILYKVFYDCIKEYKLSNKLKFSKFNKLCKGFKDDNPFKCVGLRELGENYNFEE